MMRSASVLLPWSMWAMMEKLRMWFMQIGDALNAVRTKRRSRFSAGSHRAAM
jgi:hypothetical protein